MSRDRSTLSVDAAGSSDLRTCLPRGAQARSGLVREVPPARRAAGPEAHRPRVDVARSARRRLLHERTAEDWLREIVNQARAGTLPGLVRTGVTFAEAAEEYLTWLEVDRERKPSTLRDYGSMV